MSNSIKKAVIPAAGLGTRFLPATKTIPKEMFPILDTPIILYNIEECARAGIEDVVIVAGRGKTAIEDFFDTSYELEDILSKTGKELLLETVRRAKSLVNIISIRQGQALGLGHAVSMAKPIIGREPFAVLLGDELMLPNEKSDSGVGELCRLYETEGLSSVAVMTVADSEVSKYGIIAGESKAENLWRVTDVVEKPSLQDAPSRLALPGRYIFDACIFDELKNTKPGKNGEIQLTDAMRSIATKKGMLAKTLSSSRYDAGDRLGYIQANVEVALKNSELKEPLIKYIKELAQKI